MPNEFPPELPQRRGLWAKIIGSKFLFVSVMVHLLFGLGATYYIVQSVQAKRKLTFSGGPPSTNPSKRSLEHKVSMAKKKNSMSAPAQAKRITTTGLSRVALPEMPTISTAIDVIPNKMAGMGGTGFGAGAPGGGGMGGGGGGGGTIPFFGFKGGSGGGALVGNFYDLKQTRSRKETNMSVQEYGEVISRFVSENWRESILDDYFKSPKPLYATQIMIPNMSADEGPKAFDLENKVKPSRWVVHYKGKVSPPKSCTFHFVGGGDDIMLVKFNGRLVLDRCWYARSDWQPVANYDYGFTGIPRGFAKGNAIKVEAGQWYDMEVLIGEQPGGLVFFSLLIEEEGVQYEKDSRGNPILPIFRLAAGKMPRLRDGQTFPPFKEEGGPIWKGQTSGGKGTSLLDALKR